MTQTSSDLQVLAALEALREFLSGRLSPEKMADSLPWLLERPPETVAADIRAWARGRTGPVALKDNLPPVVRRLQALGQRKLPPNHPQNAYLRRLCEAVTAEAPPVAPARLAASAASAPNAPTPHRLTLVLDRLDALKARGSAKSGTELLDEAIVSAILAAESPRQLEEGLQAIRLRRGLGPGAEEVLRVLREALPSWWVPGATATPPPAVRAFRKLIALAPDPDEGARRFAGLVEAGIEEFNRGALGRAAHVFDLAEQVMSSREVEAGRIEALRALGHERLDLDRLRRLVESPDRRDFPPALLRFFRVFEPEALLDKLRLEPRRERRRLLLAFLQTHAAEGRRAAFERLSRLPEDEHDFFLLRNLVHLLCTIPRTSEAPGEIERELARVVRLLVPESPPFLLREVLTYLEQTRHPISEQVLVHFLRTLEDALLTPDPRVWEEDRQRWLVLLDPTCAVLARYGTANAWTALVDHGLRKDAELGEPPARLAPLAEKDLGRAPEAVSRLVEATKRELPPGLLGRVPAGPGQRVLRLVTTLAGTRAAEVRELFESLAARFPQHAFGQKAAEALAALDAAPTPLPDASLSGNLDVFALPTLLQNLAETRVTGELSLLDAQGRRAATVAMDEGRIRAARYGALAGEDAVYQILERPLTGTFAFVPRKDVAPAGEATAPLDATRLLLEGLRRQDELRRASALVPDDATLEPTGRNPTAVPEETDIDLVTALWEKTVAGMSPAACEQSLSVDSFRIRRGLAHWVDEDSLRVRARA